MNNATLTTEDKAVILANEYENWLQQGKAQAHKMIACEMAVHETNKKLEAYAATRNYNESYSDWQKRIRQQEEVL